MELISNYTTQGGCFAINSVIVSAWTVSLVSPRDGAYCCCVSRQKTLGSLSLRTPLCFVLGCVFSYTQVHRVWSQQIGVYADDLNKKEKRVPTTLAEPDHYEIKFFLEFGGGAKTTIKQFTEQPLAIS